MERIIELTNGVEHHRMSLAEVTVTRLSQLFGLDPGTVYLKELSNQGVSRFPTSEGSFNLAENANEYEVEGRFQSTTSTVQAPTNNQNMYETPTGRPPVPVSMLIPGAPAVGIAPPAMARQRKRKSAPVIAAGGLQEDQLMFTNVFYSDEWNRKGRPVPKQKWPVTLNIAEANVSMINRKLSAMIGKTVQVCDSEGVLIANCDATKDPVFWGFNDGGQFNSRKFFAMPPECTKENDDVGEPSKKVLKRVEQLMERSFERERATAAAAESSFKCSMCYDVMTRPAVCLSCKAPVGCEECCLKWVESDTNNGCPLCRADWDGIGGFIIMASVDEMLSNLRK